MRKAHCLTRRCERARRSAAKWKLDARVMSSELTTRTSCFHARAHIFFSFDCLWTQAGTTRSLIFEHKTGLIVNLSRGNNLACGSGPRSLLSCYLLDVHVVSFVGVFRHLGRRRRNWGENKNGGGGGGDQSPERALKCPRSTQLFVPQDTH